MSEQESVYKAHKPQEGSGLFLKLKDGDKIKMRICSEPVISVYKKGQKPRYNWVVLNRNTGMAQVYGAGVSVFNAIADLVDEWGDPKDFDITVKRTGAGLQDTSYAVAPVKTSTDLTEEEKDLVSKVDIFAATKGKLLQEYITDNKLPDPVVETTDEEESEDDMSLDDLPL